MNKIEKIKELLKNTSLEDLDIDDCDNADDLIEYLEERINEEEVIYYSNAIKYLSENDASLQESLSLANDMGFSCKDLNSETLATILQQENMRKELYNLKTEIEAIFDEEEANA